MPRNRVQHQKGLSDDAFERLYPDEEACRKAWFAWRWPEGFKCPRCAASEYCEIRDRQLLQCRHCRYQTSLIAGTVLQGTKLPMRVWFRAMHLLAQGKKGLSNIELGRRLGISTNAAWRVQHKLMPSLPIERGRPSAGLLAHILVSKYCDHTPLYRQAGIYAREGVDLDRAVMANWVGKSVWIAAPLVEAIGDHVMAAAALHGNDTPVPVLAPGAGKTKTGRWVYLRDERPHAGPAPPAVIYRYSPDRKGEHPRRHLARFRGFLHADGYAGFGPLYQTSGDGKPASITEIACWAHVRRKFHDLHLTGSPLAKEALDRIGRLFDIERAAQGLPPDMRRRIRQSRTVPLIEELAAFLDTTLPKLSGKSEFAVAIRYARSRWQALTGYLKDGRLEISNNAAERAIWPLAERIGFLPDRIPVANGPPRCTR